MNSQNFNYSILGISFPYHKLALLHAITPSRSLPVRLLSQKSQISVRPREGGASMASHTT